MEKDRGEREAEAVDVASSEIPYPEADAGNQVKGKNNPCRHGTFCRERIPRNQRLGDRRQSTGRDRNFLQLF